MDRWPDRWRQYCAGYLILQGLAGIGWWIGLTASAAFQDWFIAPDGWLAARTVLVADVLLFGGGSILTGVLAMRRHRWCRTTMLVLVGVTAYATAVSAAWVFAPVQRWLGVVVMVPALVATCLAAAVVVARTDESSS